MPNQLPLDQTLTIKVIVVSPEEKLILANIGSEEPSEGTAHSKLSNQSEDSSERALADQILSDIKVFNDLHEVGDEATVVRTLGELNKAYGIDIEALEEISHEDLDGDKERGESEEHTEKVLGHPQEVSIDNLELEDESMYDPTLSIIDEEDDEVEVLNPNMKEGYNPLTWSYNIEEELMSEEELSLEEETVEIPAEAEKLEELNSPYQKANLLTKITEIVSKGGIVDKQKLSELARSSGVDIDGVLMILTSIAIASRTTNTYSLYDLGNGNYIIGPNVLTVQGLIKAYAGQGASSSVSGMNDAQATAIVQKAKRLETDSEIKQAISVLASAVV